MLLNSRLVDGCETACCYAMLCCYAIADVKLTHLPPQTVSFPNELVEDAAAPCYPHADALAASLVQAPQAAMVEGIIAQDLANFCDSNSQNQPIRNHGIYYRVPERSHQRLQIATIPKLVGNAFLKSQDVTDGAREPCVLIPCAYISNLL